MGKRQLIMLGTGCAMVTHCFNTCFLLKTASGDYFLTDAGGGNGILRQMESAGADYQYLHYMFITHGHTDHILGVIWVIRKIATLMNQGKYTGQFHVYCHDEAAHMLRVIADLTLNQKHKARIGNGICIHEVQDGDCLSFLGMELHVFDIHSTKAKQFGYSLRFADGMTLVCLGDEPFDEQCRPYAEGSDWLLSEAFCLYGDRDRFKPYEKHHSTVKEACETAAELDAKHVVLYHTEDTDMEHRKEKYEAEGTQYFSGPVFVPYDLEVIPLE